MTNSNYIAGRKFEYDRLKFYKEAGYTTFRTAGSHGLFDLIVIHPTLHTVTFIQCKRVSDEAEAKRMIKKFREDPPITINYHTEFHQKLEVKVKGSTNVMDTAV